MFVKMPRFLGNFVQRLCVACTTKVLHLSLISEVMFSICFMWRYTEDKAPVLRSLVVTRATAMGHSNSKHSSEPGFYIQALKRQLFSFKNGIQRNFNIVDLGVEHKILEDLHAFMRVP